MGALSGIRVVDLTQNLAGPFLTMILALGGTEVIRLESAKHMDTNRTMFRNPVTRKHPGINRSDPFNELNKNKLSVRVNLRNPAGVECARRLISISDVMVDNFAAGVVDKLGLGYQAVRQVRPDIVMFSSSTSGSSGPECHGLGWAFLFASLSGVSDMTGYPDCPPTEIRWSGDISSAHAGAVAIMGALLYRQETGKGQYIDFASRESLSCLIGDSFVDYAMTGRVQSRGLNHDDIMAPHNCYRCRGEDRWVSIAVGDESEWRSFCRAIGNPGWTTQDRFDNQYARWKNRDEMDRLVQCWTIERTHYEVTDILQRVGVAALPSFTPEDLFSDPHLRERGAYITMNHPEAGSRFSLDSPWKLSATPLKVSGDGPLFGEHTEHVFGELLGMSTNRIRQMAEEEVLF